MRELVSCVLVSLWFLSKVVFLEKLSIRQRFCWNNLWDLYSPKHNSTECCCVSCMYRCWISSLPVPGKNFHTSVYLTFQISNLLCEKNKNSLTYPLSNLCRKEEICLLPFGGKDWGYWLRTYEKKKHSKGKGSKNI